MEKINLMAGWIGIFFGFVTGAFLGIFFHNEDWLGGYSSWRRRMIRLGHISLHGLAFINMAFVLTVSYLQLKQSIVIPSTLFIVAAVTMPLCCFISAFRPSWKFLFVIPVATLLAGSGIMVYLGFVQ